MENIKEKQNENETFCPICFNLLIDNDICILDTCSHELCFHCFSQQKKHSDKCPICGMCYISVKHIKINNNEKTEEIIYLNEVDYKEIRNNKEDLLGKFYINNNYNYIRKL